MVFEQADPSIVRDIRQRALLNGWLQLAAVKSPPTPAAGKTVSYHRLLLPFAEGGSVSRIMTSLKASGDDGSFELGYLLSGIYSTPETEIAAVIRGATA